jgi:hypothetical protein
MAKKKTILIETAKTGKVWSIKVTSASQELREQLVMRLRLLAEANGLVILNAADPFGEVKPKRVRKSRPESVAA